MQNSNVKTLINTANFLVYQGKPVPVDLMARLLEAGVDIQQYQ